MSDDTARGPDGQPPQKKRRTKEEKEAARPKPPQNNPKGGCDVWIPKKTRFCNFPKEKGSRYCGHHGEERVPCPINPKHTVKKSNVEEHKLVCQDRRRLPPVTEAYYRAGANAGGDAAVAALAAPPTVAKEAIERAVEEMKEFLEGHTLPEDIPTEKLSWPSFTADAVGAGGDDDDDDDDDDEHGQPAAGASLTKHEKHAEQIGSLLGHLHKEGALPLRPITVTLHGPTKREHREAQAKGEAGQTSDNVAAGLGLRYMEFGCGKGSLAVSVARVLYGEEATDPNAAVYLVDRSNFRRKCLHNAFRRIFVDLQDLVLDGVNGNDKIVGFSKHLCGVATDFTIRACARTPQLMHCLTIALCCHHRCVHASYVNPAYLAAHGVTPERFEALKKMSSWAVDGDDQDGGAKQRLGRKAKRFLDVGRVQWLRDQGFTVRLVHFVDQSTTPENCLLVATRPAA